MDLVLPDCDLTKLLLAHIREGHRVMVLSHAEPTVRLFTTREGTAFSGKNIVIIRMCFIGLCTMVLIAFTLNVLYRFNFYPLLEALHV